MRCVCKWPTFLVLTVAGIEIARLEISLQVALALRVLGIPICD
ncbi:DUF3956 family protein [Bacillus cereus]|nr:DUF3956 family protein [Bacillus cereus]WJX07313.1 DUF3956 family protein [Bacillus cereus]